MNQFNAKLPVSPTPRAKPLMRAEAPAHDTTKKVSLPAKLVLVLVGLTLLASSLAPAFTRP